MAGIKVDLKLFSIPSCNSFINGILNSGRKLVEIHQQQSRKITGGSNFFHVGVFVIVDGIIPEIAYCIEQPNQGFRQSVSAFKTSNTGVQATRCVGRNVFQSAFDCLSVNRSSRTILPVSIDFFGLDIWLSNIVRQNFNDSGSGWLGINGFNSVFVPERLSAVFERIPKIGPRRFYFENNSPATVFTYAINRTCVGPHSPCRDCLKARIFHSASSMRAIEGDFSHGAIQSNKVSQFCASRGSESSGTGSATSNLQREFIRGGVNRIQCRSHYGNRHAKGAETSMNNGSRQDVLSSEQDAQADLSEWIEGTAA